MSIQWIRAAARRVQGYLGKKWERRQHFRLTLEGLFFIGITFAIGLAAFNTGTNLLYLICSMLLSFLILSGVVSTNSLRGLEVGRSAPRHAVAGEPCRIEVIVRNVKHWNSSFSLRVLDRLATGEAAGAAYFVSVPRKGVGHGSYRTLFPTRGLYRFGTLTLSSRFPFGLMERSWSARIPHEILVYPRLVEVRPILQQAEVELGEVESNQRGPGTSLYQLREYTGQESARHIHWKTTARTRRLMVIEFEKEEKRRVSIYLNNVVSQMPDATISERFERAVVLAGSLAKFLLESDHQVQLLTGSGKVPFGVGISHLHRCLRALAGIELHAPERHAFHLPPPEADCVNVFIHYDPERKDSVYSASAAVLSVDPWWDLLNPVASEAVATAKGHRTPSAGPEAEGDNGKSGLSFRRPAATQATQRLPKSDSKR